jgi:hypothetical protein
MMSRSISRTADCWLTTKIGLLTWNCSFLSTLEVLLFSGKPLELTFQDILKEFQLLVTRTKERSICTQNMLIEL